MVIANGYCNVKLETMWTYWQLRKNECVYTTCINLVFIVCFSGWWCVFKCGECTSPRQVVVLQC